MPPVASASGQPHLRSKTCKQDLSEIVFFVDGTRALGCASRVAQFPSRRLFYSAVANRRGLAVAARNSVMSWLVSFSEGLLWPDGTCAACQSARSKEPRNESPISTPFGQNALSLSLSF